jgi:hypothetical protein
MRLNLRYIILLMAIFSCVNKRAGGISPCKEVDYHDTSAITIVNRWVFDTTANQFRAKIIEGKNAKGIGSVRVNLIKDARIIGDSTDQTGLFNVFKNDFERTWDLKLEAEEHGCIIIKGIEIRGGQYAIIKLPV